MSELPAVIAINEEHKTLLINGEVFPWVISEDGVSVLTGEGCPAVRITLLAERVDWTDGVTASSIRFSTSGAEDLEYAQWLVLVAEARISREEAAVQVLSEADA